jgi:restriction system protein
LAERTFWGIHAKGTKVEEVLLSRHQLAIGWPNLGDLTPIVHDREAIKAKLKIASPDEKPGAVPVIAGELFRFANEMAVGDVVIYRSNEGGQVHLGEVTGPYSHDPSYDPEHPNRRPVKWVKKTPSTAVSLGALHELGSALAFFQVKNYADEWAQILAGGTQTATDDSDEVVSVVAEASEQNTRDFILKRLAGQLKGHPFAHFVANLLQTMGYRTQVSPAGPDGGIDIVAHRGELGFEPPIVRVQVKSSESGIGGPIVSELLGNPRARRVRPDRDLGLLHKPGKIQGQAAHPADRWGGTRGSHPGTLRGPRRPLQERHPSKADVCAAAVARELGCPPVSARGHRLGLVGLVTTPRDDDKPTLWTIILGKRSPSYDPGARSEGVHGSFRSRVGPGN